MLNLVANGPSGYNLTNSLRFRSSASAYLSRTPGVAPTSNKIMTLSMWVKRGALGSPQQSLMGSPNTGNADNFRFSTSDTLSMDFQDGAVGILTTTQVFRDPSAWYHIVLSIDTTQATASNRAKIYVNGSQVTAFGTATYPAQNTIVTFSSQNATYLGRYGNAAQNYFDGYITEVNFIDGQALTPSSFGSTNSTTGVWKPAKYTGTYGTNGFYLPFKLNSTSTYQANYTTTSQYLSVASNAAFGYGTGDFTIEGWHYATASGTSYLFDQRTSTSQVVPALYISGGSYTVYINGAIPLTAGTVVTNQWVHWALVKSSGTTKLYLNGISVGSFSDSNNYITSPFIIGNVYTGTTYAWAGYLSNVRVVKGTAVYTSNFTPSSTPLTAISGTSLLTLQNATIIDNSSNAFTITNNGTITTSTATPFVANIAGDASGNGNSWQTNNINYSTVGTTYDAMLDVPTLTSATVANYCVNNPVDTSPAGGVNAITISGANLNLAGASTDWAACRATIGVTSGKWYWECTRTGSSNLIFGIGLNSTTLTYAYSSTSYGYFSTGDKYSNNVSSAYGASFASGDVIGVAFDADAGTLTFYKNNTSQGTAFTGLTSGPYFPLNQVYTTGSTASINFGQRPFSYTPPTGFVALNTYNLPTPTILQGNKYMDATLYTGNGSTQTITNAGGFKPDLVWVKSRSAATDNKLTDSVRGVQKGLISDTTGAETTDTNGLTAFNSNGWSLGTDTVYNNNAATYVGWQWQAGQGSSSSNTSGSITSTVSVNTTAGFSVVTYTGTSTAGTIGHGLGVAPKMIIVKPRSATGDWIVYTSTTGAGNFLLLDTTAASAASTTKWNNTAPTSSVFSVGIDTTTNFLTTTYVAYCWAEIAGFSKFGSYTGNGSADGPFVYTGFRPKYILVKSSSNVMAWYLYDTARNSYNVADTRLNTNNAFAEATGGGFGFDILSNGFKARTSDTIINGSGYAYIYMAFAESPFNNSLAR